MRQQERTDYYIRLGDTVQRAGREQMARLFQSGGLVSVEKMPVHGSSLAELDMRRLEDYFLSVLGEEAVADWRRTLLNRELLVADEWRPGSAQLLACRDRAVRARAAAAHAAGRDYGCWCSREPLTVYADRLEVQSPGALPNGVTVEKAKEGLRVPRNPNIVNILRDYDFMEHRGMGIRRKVIP